MLSIINKTIVNKANVKTDINNKPNENTDINNIIINNPNDNADNKINIKETNIITSLKKFESTNEDKALNRMMEIDKLATDIYTIKQRSGYIGGLDYTMPIFLMNKRNFDIMKRKLYRIKTSGIGYNITS